MTYDEAIKWLLSFADFERSGRFQDRPDVAPMLALLERLGNPHYSPDEAYYPDTIHIAGSKGKGSAAEMVTSILCSNDYATGLYTSPHLYSYRERMQICGDLISEERLAWLVTKELRPAVETVVGDLPDRALVTFDLLTALAFLHFFHWYGERKPVEYQVVEVGLGGRVDSTNVFEYKELAVLMPISLEHTEVLGTSVEEIAREKAAIITPRSTVVLAPQPYPAAAEVIRHAALNKEAPDEGEQLIDVGKEYRWELLSHDLRAQKIRIEGPAGVLVARLPLLGRHQIENATTAVACADAMNRRREDEVRITAVTAGLASVRWPCRIEVLREDPLVIADGAHNRDSARRLAETLVEYFACDRALFVIGCGSDKDIDGLADELAPLASRVLAVRSEHPRAMHPQRIVEAFGRLSVDSEIVDKVPAAVDSAIAAAGSRALICVAGSLFVAAEARAHVLGVGT